MLTHGQLHRCSPKGEIFVMYPRADAGNPHASYHLDGTYHHKKLWQHRIRQTKQPLTAAFQ
jgi:alkylation response protein AidB-like acyl-CoA dehydrogenase